MDKRYLIIIGIIAGLIAIGLIVFWVLYSRGSIAPTEIPFSGLFPSAAPKTPEEQIPQTPPPTTPPFTIHPGQKQALTQLTQKAVSGATFIEKIQPDKTKIETVRYFEKATGHIYDIDLQKGTSVRISNVTIPRIFEVHWSPDGEQAVIRYTENNDAGVTDTIRNFSIVSIGATSSASTHGTFLLSTISAIAPSPKENKVFSMVPFEDTNIGVISSFEDKKQKQVLISPFGEWRVDWPSEKIITFLSKPSSVVGGYLYKLDPVSGSFERILANINGLTALYSPDGERILYSGSSADGLKTNIYIIKDKKTIPFNLDTLPEKCVWSALSKGVIYCAVPASLPAAAYPDNWYQGLVSFYDKIWKIDTLSGVLSIISSENQPEFDAINLFLSKNENYLFFQNKKDGTLWSIKLR
jgi:hypothetical protein